MNLSKLSISDLLELSTYVNIKIVNKNIRLVRRLTKKTPRPAAKPAVAKAAKHVGWELIDPAVISSRLDADYINKRVTALTKVITDHGATCKMYVRGAEVMAITARNKIVRILCNHDSAFYVTKRQFSDWKDDDFVVLDPHKGHYELFEVGQLRKLFAPSGNRLTIRARKLENAER